MTSLSLNSAHCLSQKTTTLFSVLYIHLLSGEALHVSIMDPGLKYLLERRTCRSIAQQLRAPVNSMVPCHLVCPRSKGADMPVF